MHVALKLALLTLPCHLLLGAQPATEGDGAIGDSAATPTGDPPKIDAGIHVPPFLSCSDNEIWDALRDFAEDSFFILGEPRVSKVDAQTLQSNFLFDRLLRSCSDTYNAFIIDDGPEPEQQGVMGGFSDLFRWAESPLSERSASEQQVCLFGHLTCIYFIGWYRHLRGEDGEALSSLLVASNVLDYGRTDWSEHSSWPVTSWDIYVNLFRLSHGLRFLLAPKPMEPVHPWSDLVPSVWPVPVPQPTRWAESVSVYYIGMHAVPFSDILAFLQEWWSPTGGVEGSGTVTLHPNYMGYPGCCPPGACPPETVEQQGFYGKERDWVKPYCTKDPRLYRLLRIPQLHDHSDGQWENAYRSHSPARWAEAKAEFRLHYHDWLRREVDLFLCGHPIYWCTLFEELLHPPDRKAMIAVYDQPPFFLVGEDAQDGFAETLRNLADPAQYPTAVVVGFAPFFARQFEWRFNRKIPHSRPIALNVKDTWYPSRPHEVLVATAIDAKAIALLQRFEEANKESFLNAEGQPMHFVYWERDLGYMTPKADLVRYRAVVMLPYDFAHFKLPEFVAMGMPIFMHKQLWKWTVRWSQLIAKPAGKNVSGWYRQAPEACYAGGSLTSEEASTSGLPLPDLPRCFWQDPWGSHCEEARIAAAAAGRPDECLEALRAWQAEDGPYGISPFALFTLDRHMLRPFDSAAFWSQWSEMALVPNTIYFDSIPHLLRFLQSKTLEELRETSKAQRRWHKRTAFQVVDFWRGLIGSLLDGSATAFKGPAR